MPRCAKKTPESHSSACGSSTGTPGAQPASPAASAESQDGASAKGTEAPTTATNQLDPGAPAATASVPTCSLAKHVASISDFTAISTTLAWQGVSLSHTGILSLRSGFGAVATLLAQESTQAIVASSSTRPVGMRKPEAIAVSLTYIWLFSG